MDAQTVEQAWEEYRDREYQGPKASFYAGAAAVFTIINTLGEQSVNAAEFDDGMQALKVELERYLTNAAVAPT